MFLEQLEILKDFNIVSVIVRLTMALFLGALLGLEREQKQRPAGLRTYTLVCVGSALASITNLYMCQMYAGVDPSRIPAQIISGIGFLGAGTILVTKVHRIKGLTTAAGLWCCAAVGIAVGAGFYSGALISGLMIIVSLRLFSFVDDRFSNHSKYMNFYAEYMSKDFISDLITYSRENNYQLFDLEISRDSKGESFFATFQLKITNPGMRLAIRSDLQNLPGCTVIEELK
ncbi:MAG: MgtC/SapB family protein [Lachnospira sp.]